MTINLFELQVPVERQHPIFKMLLQDHYAPERAVLQRWAEGFDDRDNKFVQEFQMSFESSFWELYLHAALKEWQLPVDMRYHAPDFVVGGAHPFGLEATIAAPRPEGRLPTAILSMTCPVTSTSSIFKRRFGSAIALTQR